jgi:hypothetical protein
MTLLSISSFKHDWYPYRLYDEEPEEEELEEEEEDYQENEYEDSDDSTDR